MTSTQTRQGGSKHILIARPAAVFAEDVTDAYVAFEVLQDPSSFILELLSSCLHSIFP